MRFSKWHGIGNDYLIVETADLEAEGLHLDEDLARRLCDRHFGPGGDGILELAHDAEADARMTIHNPDGSHAEMCGNGVRMAARYLVERWGLPAGGLTLATAGGTVRPQVLDDGSVRVEMGVGQILGEATVTAAGDEFTGTKVRIGNPHFVVARTPTDEYVLTAGPIIEVDAEFPDRTNVEFWEQTGPSSLRMRVWERGVGETLACGSGACATALAAVRSGVVTSPVEVALPGGALVIEIADDDLIVMTGPAEAVYDGELSTSTIRQPAPTGA